MTPQWLALRAGGRGAATAPPRARALSLLAPPSVLTPRAPPPPLLDASDALPLSVAILARAAAESPARCGALDPARFMQLLRDLWGGDARDVPPSIAFLRSFPTVFALDV